MGDSTTSDLVALPQQLEQAQSTNRDLQAKVIQLQAQALEAEQLRHALAVAHEEVQCLRGQVEQMRQHATQQQQQQDQALEDSKKALADADARIKGMAQRLRHYEFDDGEQLLLFVARRQLEAWDAPTQASVMRLSKAMYAEFLPRVSRAIVRPICSRWLNDDEPAESVRRFSAAVALQELSLVYGLYPRQVGPYVEAQVAALTHLTGLRSLSIHREQHPPRNLGSWIAPSSLKLPALHSVRSVSEVHIKGFHVTDIHHLGDLHQLVSLDFDMCDVDLNLLPTLPNLHTVRLRTTSAEGLDKLACQPALKVLHMVHMGLLCVEMVRRMMPQLAELTGLHELSLHGCQQHPTPLDHISRLTALTHLDVSHTMVRETDALAALVQLKVLYASCTLIHSLNALTALTQLQVLDVSCSLIDSLNALTALTQLQVLKVSNTAVNSLHPLAALTQLQVLGVSQMEVESLQPLSALTQLQVLDVSQTEVESPQPLQPLSALSQLRVLKADDL